MPGFDSEPLVEGLDSLAILSHHIPVCESAGDASDDLILSVPQPSNPQHAHSLHDHPTYIYGGQ